MATLNLALAAELQSLEPSAIVSMYELHLDDEVHYFHAGVNEYFGPLVWGGRQYTPFPVLIEGFEQTTNGSLPRPKMRLANIEGVISALLLERDIVGAKVVRRRTTARYLDAVNFKGGNPTADPTVELPSDVYFIDQKKSEDDAVVEFELRSSLEMTNVMLPRRQIIQNACPWAYRGADCGYTGGPCADIHDNPVTEEAQDQCGKRLRSCKLRFGSAVLPFGGFPAAGLMRV
ncbi:phage tail protein [Comamonas thiooxydans]|uniref:phage minor tail protein L n=1 Tax=Comamonas thiooxydans TaxID=363952 RepID=UPI0007C5D9E0|nr:phage minor tail protein L [Comamonas thiooxydans]OAD82867.1 phage tail protein [Comamonas thiooxydans]